MHVIRTSRLRREFGTLVAVDSLDLTVGRGEIFGLVGPDGAGKTTTMRMLAGVLAPTGGEAAVAGFDVCREPEQVKMRIGYMSQRFGLYPDLNVMENIRFYADLYGVSRPEFDARIGELLGFSNLAPFKRRLAGNLSGGMKQKLGLACALIHKPEVLLLDEPTNGVDPVSRREFWRILNQLVRDGVTVFVSTAYLDEAERCSHLVLLDRGRVLGQGTPREVREMLPGETWEIVGPQTRAMGALMRRAMPEAVVAVYGDRLHLSVEGMKPESIGRLLMEGGFEPAEIRRIKPSLETVFVGVLARRKNPAQAAGS